MRSGSPSRNSTRQVVQRVPATGVQLIDSRILLECQNQPLTLRHFILTYALDRELRHGVSPHISEKPSVSPYG